MTSSTRLPTVWPTPIAAVYGALRAQEESKTLPVRQFTPVYWTAVLAPGHRWP